MNTSLSETMKWDGISLVSGYAKGNALVLRPFSDYIVTKSKNPVLEQQKFRHAIKMLDKELSKALKSKISEEQKSLLEMSRMLLQDRGWNRKIEEVILNGFTAETAIHQATDEVIQRLKNLEDTYLREKANDFQDLAWRLLHCLNNPQKEKSFDSVILVAKNLGPAQLMDYDLSKIKGIVLSEGGLTSHITIIARTYEIPLITGINGIWEKIQSGDYLILNAEKGILYKDPTDEVINELLINEKKAQKQKLVELKNKNDPAFTTDGVKIELGINLGLADDLMFSNVPPFDKIGLYRTELPFMLAKELPDCETQTRLYKKVLLHAKEKPVYFRTLDIGSDKVLPYTHPIKEENPAMGWRSTRMTLDRRALLRTQLQALIRAVEGEPLYVMFPMIAEISEFLIAKQTLDFELNQAKINHETLPSQIFVGTMLEIPSLYFYLKNNEQVFDFISIGTNDLKQFFFASDRGNRILSSRYDNLSPAFLTFLKEIRSTCQKKGIPCSVCGEMAGNPLEAMVLIGLGFKSLSMNPHVLLKIKTALRKLNQADFSEYINRLLKTENISVRPAISAYLRDHHILED